MRRSPVTAVHDGPTVSEGTVTLPTATLVEALSQIDLTARSCVTIGVFDGVHRGHQQLVAAMVQAAHSTHNAAVALTFDPHPATTLGYEPPPLLTTVEERVELLAALGLDALIMLPFTPVTAHTPAADFVESLVRHLHLAELWGGPDFAFGYQREGNIPFLRQLGAERGFTIHIVEPLVWDGAPVNSSRVRAALREGDTRQATGCLGRPYRLTGVVVPGEATISLVLPAERLIPAAGIYVCLAHTEHSGTHTAAVNVRPASTGQTPVAEVHLPDLDLAGQTLALDFVTRLPDKLQDERPFPTPRQIAGCRLQQ
jgi:riboflavin kinase/FMN adenylyltransferase